MLLGLLDLGLCLAEIDDIKNPQNCPIRQMKSAEAAERNKLRAEAKVAEEEKVAEWRKADNYNPAWDD